VATAAAAVANVDPGWLVGFSSSAMPQIASGLASCLLVSIVVARIRAKSSGEEAGRRRIRSGRLQVSISGSGPCRSDGLEFPQV